MHINYGFVSICLSEKDCSPASSVTYRSIESLDAESQRLRILRATRRNFENTLRIMWFLKAHDIRLYRISATLVPLATHPVTDGWAWWDEPSLVELGEKIGRIARLHEYRLSSHLPEVCGLTSPESWRWMQRYLTYHRRLFDLLHLGDDARIVVHTGGAYGEKEEALETARANLARLDDWARRRLALENDDRTYTLSDVCDLAEGSGIAVVCDWHHHVVNPGGCGDSRDLLPLLARAHESWRDRVMKVHVSSPRSAGEKRAHADFVDAGFVRPFVQQLLQLELGEVDFMVEAKQKDRALFRLREELGTRVTAALMT